MRALWLLWGLVLSTPAWSGQKRVAVVVDTSGSMSNNDAGRNSVLAAQLLADLLGDSDHYSVLRLAFGEMPGCLMVSADSSLESVFSSARRAASKQEIDQLISYGGGNYFCAPVRTALHSLKRGPPDAQRMVLFLADADDFGTGGQALRAELGQFGSSGGLVASLTVRNDARGEFVGPPFTYAERARSSKGIVLGLAKLYQRFVGSSQIQSGSLGSTIELKVDPFVSAAFLVVADQGRVEAPTPRPGHPGATSVERNYRGGSVVRGLDGLERSYAITRLERPAAGAWTFDVAGAAGAGGWMFVQEYALGVRAVADLVLPVGAETNVVVELFDEDRGVPITDFSDLPGAEVLLEHEGKSVRLVDDGTGGDAVAGDGKYTGQVLVEKPGPLQFRTRVKTPFSEQTDAIEGTGVVATWQLVGSLPGTVQLGADVPLRVKASPTASRFSGTPPDHLSGPSGPLRDDGVAPDRTAGDGEYSGAWRPVRMGAATVNVSADDPLVPPLSMQTTVLGVLRLSPMPVDLGAVPSEQVGEARIDWGSSEVRGEFQLDWLCPFRSAGAVLELWDGAEWVPLDGATTRVTSTGQLGDRIRVRVGTCPSAWQGPTTVEVQGSDGTRIDIAVELEIVADPWLRCYWWIPAGLLGTLFSAWWVNGWLFPSRFARNLTIALATEEHMEDANKFQVRYARGFRRRWRTDDAIYVHPSWSLSTKAGGAVARIRAERRSLKIRAEGGRPLETQGWEGDWETVPEGESSVQIGAVYRLKDAGLYFQVLARV